MTTQTRDAAPKKPAPLVLGAIGVVFGDIGTSPLYTLKEAFGPKYGLHAGPGATCSASCRWCSGR